MSLRLALYARAVLRGGALGGKLDPALQPRDASAILRRLVGTSIRGLAWKWRMQSCGPHLLVARGARITSAHLIRCGRRVKFEEHCEVQGLSRRGLRFGDSVTIGRGACIRPSSYYGGPLGEGLTVGDGSSIGAYSWFGVSGYVEIGRDVLCGPRVTIISENHRFDDPDLAIRQQGVERADVLIEDDCWIGTGATILAGVTIGRGSVVAAGAVVTKSVAPYSIVGGAPARLIRNRA